MTRAKGTKRSRMGLRQTEEAIKFIKDRFEHKLARTLHLTRVSAPLAVLANSGINDHLNGVEKPASFRIKAMGETAEIVQSLAKWKRQALGVYGFRAGEGLYTDMNAVRPDEELDALHSFYVDQWDWEVVIGKRERHLKTLTAAATSIYRIVRTMERETCRRYPKLGVPALPSRMRFIQSEELLKRYPHLDPRAREDAICREWGAVFIIGIGAKLSDGRMHDGRAADYDDWSTETEAGYRGLNGDILVWNPVLKRAFELSSMGIRVDAAALKEQLRIRREQKNAALPFHRALLSGKLPLTMGGGIGQSRLCMFFLRCRHIGEVQAGIWPAAMRRRCHAQGIALL